MACAAKAPLPMSVRSRARISFQDRDCFQGGWSRRKKNSFLRGSLACGARVQGRMSTDITGDASGNRGIENPMADVVADSILFGTQGGERGTQRAFTNVGGGGPACATAPSPMASSPERLPGCVGCHPAPGQPRRWLSSAPLPRPPSTEHLSASCAEGRVRVSWGRHGPSS